MTTKQQMKETSCMDKGGLSEKMLYRVRTSIHKKFLAAIQPTTKDHILDIGASADPAFIASNYLETRHPTFKITALGLDAKNPEWERLYPNASYVQGNGLNLPFSDEQFDIVYSHAVIEHVGNLAKQQQFLTEAVRVAKKSVWITTPNRWHPLETHTVLPFIHWLPKPLYRKLLPLLGKSHFANENVLNLLDEKTLRDLLSPIPHIRHQMHHQYFLGLPSNLLLHIEKQPK